MSADTGFGRWPDNERPRDPLPCVYERSSSPFGFRGSNGKTSMLFPFTGRAELAGVIDLEDPVAQVCHLAFNAPWPCP